MGRLGRNEPYSEEVAEEILERIAQGEFLTRICATPDMPHRTTVVDLWCKIVEGFAARYKQARDAGFDERLERALLAFYESPGVIVDENGRTRIDPAWVQLVKAKFWGELEALKRWDPQRYGDMIKQQHSGLLTLEQLVTGSYSSKKDDGDSV